MRFKKVYLDPENKTFAEVMSNGKSYAVPAFQRDYSWEEEQLEETHKRYLGVFDVVTLTTSPKLSLNRNNKNHFRKIVALFPADGYRRATLIGMRVG